MNQIEVPRELLEPPEWVSVLVSSYNTKFLYIKECLDSIKSQNGHFGIELVWIDDGSDNVHGQLLERELENFRATTRFTRVVFSKNPTNRGIAQSLYDGVNLCTCEIIVKMDSDDIMFPDRIKTQLAFMKSHSDCVMVGSDLQLFRQTTSNPQDKTLMGRTNHPAIMTWEQFKQTRSEWFANHPTLCYKKSAILAVGNYDVTMGSCLQDYEIELRILKRFGRIYNIPEVLLYYRIHENQVTYNGNASNPENRANRERILQKILA
jgi:glycosyltransferase involved in cell wall biosynthesis